MNRIKTNSYDNKGDGSMGSRRHSTTKPLQKRLIFFSLCAALLLARLLLPLLGSPRHVPSSSSYSPEAEKACRDVQAALPLSQKTTHFPGDAAYWSELSHYWSKSLAELRPACVVQPATAAQVAAVVRVLNHANHASVRFAVKSGGHDPNPGHASVDGGVLIALRHMKGARYDAEKGVAYVKPGGKWNDVMGDLEPHGVTIVGGRLGIVGVGGFLLQGGMSFLSAQHGLAADSIVAWETVMANGTVVNITQERHPDLAAAMRGGGNQFGIVTQFTVKTRPMGKIWGGVRVYRRKRWEQLQAALHGFVTTGAEDPKAAIIFADFFMFKNAGVYSVFFFYDGENPPSTGPFAEMLKVSATVDFTSTKRYSSMLWSNGFLADWIKGRVLFRTFTFPAIPGNPRVYDEIATQWRRIMLGGYLDRLRHLPSQCSVEFQPLPAAVGRQSERAGGNAMGLREADPDRVVLNLQCMWHWARDDAAVRALAAEMTAWLAGRLPAWNRQAGLVDSKGGDEEAVPIGAGEGSGDGGETATAGAAGAYMPLFMNDAMSDQGVLRSYRGYDEFRELQRSVDPEGMFRNRVAVFHKANSEPIANIASQKPATNADVGQQTGDTKKHDAGDSDGTSPMGDVADMRQLCLQLRSKLDTFLDTQTDDKVLEGVQAQVRIAQSVIEDALKRYRPDELLIAYNGGKDCLVLLILILASLPSHFPFQHPPTSNNSSPQQNHNNNTRTVQSSNSLASRFPHALQALYIRPPRPFAEVDAFVAETTATYHLDLATSDKPMKTALAEYLVERPRVKAVFVGTRRTDPHGAALTFFDETDQDWPRFMRVHPVIDWHYREVWGFIRALDIPYCPLYDMGYTSLGGTDDTHPNPALRREGDGTEEEKKTNTGFRPAYELMEDDEERLGRDR